MFCLVFQKDFYEPFFQSHPKCVPHKKKEGIERKPQRIAMCK